MCVEILGLHAVADLVQNFYDPVTDRDYHYKSLEAAWDPTWYSGEPVWESAENAGVITANLMWWVFYLGKLL